MVNNQNSFRIKKLSVLILTAILGFIPVAHAVEFNTDILDAEDKSNIDLSRFSQAGYIMPGKYSLSIKVNDHTVQDVDIFFYERPEKKQADGTIPVEECLPPAQISLLGLKSDASAKLGRWHNDECVDFSGLPGIALRGDLAESSLLISIPQAWLEYQDASWLPPSRWEDGVPGVIVDYNVNTIVSRPIEGQQTENISGTGTLGANLGPWRFRGDWQANYDHTNHSGLATQRSFDWSRIYSYRTIRSLQSKLTLGEDYLTSNLFDTWRYTGASLVSDDRMLPPRLRGYAPEVTGIARTNAKVVISQQNRVLYESTVAAGPFRIQELSDSVNGTLDVRVEEQDGSIQTFQVNTATIPYLTRPGQLRYKMAAGRPTGYDHHLEGPGFGTGEFSWGISNSWSLYGGAIAAGDYNALAVGLGRDLLAFGALSADVTQSVAQLPNQENRQGKSWRLSYSKRFDEYNSEITFAGYRFSERDYLSMGEFLDALSQDSYVAQDKELYTITANKSFSDLRLSAYLSYSHQTYWNQHATDRYSLSLSRYFDLDGWHNLSTTVSATRSDYNSRRDNTAYISLSVPLSSGTLSYNGNLSNSDYSQTAGWFQRLENNDSYRLSAGTRSAQDQDMTTQASGFYSHRGDVANVDANVSWVQNSFTSAGLSLAGGITATAQGAALHPSGTRGGTRMMIATDGVGGVPIERNERTNAFGIAVVPDISSYYRNTTSIDVTHLPDDVETSGSPVAESALTEGAIGYRRFNVLKGAKVIATLRLSDGSSPPFGASIRNGKNRELGIVSDEGLAWLAGINPGEELSVNWNGAEQCMVTIPSAITENQLLLPCESPPG